MRIFAVLVYISHGSIVCASTVYVALVLEWMRFATALVSHGFWAPFSGLFSPFLSSLDFAPFLCVALVKQVATNNGNTDTSNAYIIKTIVPAKKAHLPSTLTYSTFRHPPDIRYIYLDLISIVFTFSHPITGSMRALGGRRGCL